MNSGIVGVMLLEAGLLVGVFYVGADLRYLKVNGPCCMCLWFLLAWRIVVISTIICAAPCWSYLWGVMFGYAFLYAIHHLAHVVNLARKRCVGKLEPGEASPVLK